MAWSWIIVYQTSEKDFYVDWLEYLFLQFFTACLNWQLKQLGKFKCIDWLVVIIFDAFVWLSVKAHVPNIWRFLNNLESRFLIAYCNSINSVWLTNGNAILLMNFFVTQNIVSYSEMRQDLNSNLYLNDILVIEYSNL